MSLLSFINQMEVIFSIERVIHRLVRWVTLRHIHSYFSFNRAGVSYVPIKVSHIILHFLLLLLVFPMGLMALEKSIIKACLGHSHTHLCLHLLEELLHCGDLICDVPYIRSHCYHFSTKTNHNAITSAMMRSKVSCMDSGAISS